MRVAPLAALVLALVPAAREGAHAACADLAGVILARIAVEQACPCAAAASARDYRRCVRQVVAARVTTAQLSRDCAADVRACTRRSICGRPGSVTCCTARPGGTRCRVRPSAARCTAAGGLAGTCASCCELCNPSCPVPTTTTTLPPQPCDLSAPTCGGTCPIGSHCALETLGRCACIADGTIGCGEAAFPACAGSCPPTRQCQAVAVRGSVILDLCLCVPATAACSPPGSACPEFGTCAPGSVCGAFLAGGGPPECGCRSTTTTTSSTPGTTTTTTLAPGTACGDSPYPSCGGECAPGERCQAVHATDVLPAFDVRLCQCVPAASTCSHVAGGTCPGACPPGLACTLFIAGGGPPECGCASP